MSIGAVAKATRDALQTAFSLDSNSCEVGFDGQPKPACGEKYYAVHQVSHGAVSGDWDLGEEYQLAVTITLRMGFAPKDRWGISVWLATGGLEELCRQAIVSIHHNQALRIAANVYITGGASGKILTPLQFIRLDNPTPRDYSWFTAAQPEGDRPPECGASQTITFGKCQRCQSIPDMD